MSVYESRRAASGNNDPQLKGHTIPGRRSVHYMQGYRDPQTEHDDTPEKTRKMEKKIPFSKDPPAKMLRIPDISRLKLENEKLIILALMVILMKEGADMKLIAALAYILL